MAGRVRGCSLAGVVTSSSPEGVAVAELSREADVAVEAAGAEAVRRYGAEILRRGVSLVVCSAAALTDDDVRRELHAAARSGGARWVLPPGAIGGLDLLASAVRAGDTPAEVLLTTVKRPEALGVTAHGRTVVFEGTAREAARRFPRTSNIAVTLALATAGLDLTRVVVVADPAASRTRHEIHAVTSVGEYSFAFVNDTLPASGGRTSAITLWSVVSALEELAPERSIV